MCVGAVGGCFDPQKGCTENERDNSAINTQTHTHAHRTMLSVCNHKQSNHHIKDMQTAHEHKIIHAGDHPDFPKLL